MISDILVQLISNLKSRSFRGFAPWSHTGALPFDPTRGLQPP